MVYSVKIRSRVISPEEINAYTWTKGEWQKIVPSSQPKEVVDVYREGVLSRLRAKREAVEPERVAEKIATIEQPAVIVAKYEEIKAYIVWGSGGHSAKGIPFDDRREVAVYFWVEAGQEFSELAEKLLDKAVQKALKGINLSDVKGWHEAYTAVSSTGRFDDKEPYQLKFAKWEYYLNKRRIGKGELFTWF